MRKFCELFFLADVSSSAIATSFQQVHLGRSEAPSEMQVVHSEQVALERPGALCSALEGVECQHSSGAKHRFCIATKLNAGSRLQHPHRSRGLLPSCKLLRSRLHRIVAWTFSDTPRRGNLGAAADHQQREVRTEVRRASPSIPKSRFRCRTVAMLSLVRLRLSERSGLAAAKILAPETTTRNLRDAMCASGQEQSKTDACGAKLTEMTHAIQ